MGIALCNPWKVLEVRIFPRQLTPRLFENDVSKQYSPNIRAETYLDEHVMLGNKMSRNGMNPERQVCPNKQVGQALEAEWLENPEVKQKLNDKVLFLELQN